MAIMDGEKNLKNECDDFEYLPTEEETNSKIQMMQASEVQLREKLEQMSNKVKWMEADKEHHRSSFKIVADRLEDENKRLKEKLEKSESRMVEIRVDLEVATRDKKEKIYEVRNLKEVIVEMEKELKEAKEKAQTLQNDVAQRDAAIASYKKSEEAAGRLALRFEEVKKKLEESEKECKKSDESSDRYEKKYNQARQELNAYKAQNPPVIRTAEPPKVVNKDQNVVKKPVTTSKDEKKVVKNVYQDTRPENVKTTKEKKKADKCNVQ